MEGIENVIIVVEKDVSRASTVLQDGDHLSLKPSILVPYKGFQAPGNGKVLHIENVPLPPSSL